MRPAGEIRSASALVTVLIAVAGLIGCTSEGEESSPVAGQSARIELTSEAFAPGEPIPAKHTFDGDDLSPPLSWSAVPQGTKELALICDDPDAPTAEPWVHWVIYKIPADAGGLPEGVAQDPSLSGPVAALQGKSSWTSGQMIGYRGPKPPSGTHRYFFKLYALDSELDLEPGLDKRSLLEAIEGHVLGQGELMGTYQR